MYNIYMYNIYIIYIYIYIYLICILKNNGQIVFAVQLPCNSALLHTLSSIYDRVFLKK